MWKKKDATRGSTFLTFLIMTTLFVAFLGAGLNLFIGGQKRAASIGQRNQAYYLAEAGIEEALRRLKESGCTTISPTSLPFPSLSPIGTYQYRVNPGEGNSVTITSIGRVGGKEVRLHVTVLCAPPSGDTPTASPQPTPTASPLPIPPLDMAVFASQSVTLGGSAQIYGNVGINGRPGSIVLNGNPRIFGTAYVGPSGNEGAIQHPSWQSLQYFIQGGSGVLDNTRTYQLPPFPTFPTLTNKGNFTAGWWPSPPYYITEDGQYNKLEVKSTLIINVGNDKNDKRILRVKELSVTGSGKIILNGNGKLILYVDEKITLENGGGVNVDNNNNPKDASKIFLYFKGSNLNLPNDVRFAGNIYAESANITISNSGKVIGNILTGGNQVTIDGDSSAYVRAVYAPNAGVKLQGSGKVKGVIIAKTFYADGGTSVTFQVPSQEIVDCFVEFFGSNNPQTTPTPSPQEQIQIPKTITEWVEEQS
ncbi:polymer-forming cytoskeletal protein [Candidatus Caldatribacterium sp.]|uniref:polymer-forming cytoskeletal protein n=1 Tax=Candidatus Caldatribacterium sp. TaxID=2282143 RepID=UPI002998B0BF|nr:polymer-forming cytoskeletal protein [Candidatus Caldatribacterium sp.]MDW8082044.1 polymer-forming cytoskeletal protein [Candidatus Calescibacterium sp.]